MSARVLVFGAGPAGMTAAICAAREGADVTIVEKTDRAGRKLSMSGNGRGNLTNTVIDENAYHTSSARAPLSFPGMADNDELFAFFESTGVLVRAEGSFVYPASGQASSVVTALESEMESLGIKVVKNAQLKSINVNDDGSFTCSAGGMDYDARAVVLATGGMSGPATCKASGDAWYICEKLGLKTYPARASLVPLVTSDDTLPEKTGVRAWGTVKLFASDRAGKERIVADEFGEIQFTRDLLSGMPVLQASGTAAGEAAAGSSLRAEIDLFPEYDDDGWDEKFKAALFACKDRSVSGFLRGSVNSELASSVIKRLGLDGDSVTGDLTGEEARAISHELRHFGVGIKGVGSFERAQATAGGVSLDEVGDDLCCVRIPGLYIAGELLDADGRCGGYNLHWAFLSGMIAGRAAGKRVL